MNKLAKLIQKLGYDDLQLIKKDLESGNIEKLIARRLAELNKKEEKQCPVCGASFAPAEGLRIEFGPQDLRQQAHFDAPDCLQFFTKQRLKTH